MSTAILMRRTENYTLVPTDEFGREMMRHVNGDVLARISKPRNIGHHRKLFALLNLIKVNQEHYQTLEQVLAAFKYFTGHCDTVYVHDDDGVVREVYVPRSISFAAMDQTEFNAWWEKVCDVVCARIIPGLDRADLERELMEFMR